MILEPWKYGLCGWCKSVINGPGKHVCKEISMKPKFKKGDRVRVTHGPYPEYFVLGKTYVVAQDGDGNPMCYDERGHKTYMSATKYELVTEDNSELQRLVDEANRGVVALNEISSKYRGQIEQDAGQYGWISAGVSSVYAKYRIKPTPKPKLRLEPEGWDVEIKGDKVSVGCKEFPLSNLASVLRQLTNGAVDDGYNIGIYQASFRATRNSIAHEGNTLSWESADALLKFLEENK